MRNRTAFLLFVASILIGCGGGGGSSSGDSSPSNLNPGGGTGNPSPSVNVGIFSDAPVAGLKYRQGQQEGFTDSEGKFQYDSNSSVPVEFLIGHASLGFADGAGLVTPFDLNESMASTHRGLNISRLLITLDVDGNPDNGIELPESTHTLIAELPFDMAPEAFDQDQQVKSFSRQAGVDELVSVDVAQLHMLKNPRIQAQLSETTQMVDQINRLNIEFDPDISTAGLLASFRLDNGEQLYIFGDPLLPNLMSSALYIDPASRYYFVRFDAAGLVRYVNSNGAASRVVTNTVENTMAKFLQAFDISNYRGSAENVLVGIAGGAGASSLNWSYSSIAVITSAMNGFPEGQLSTTNMVQVAATIMGAMHQIRCGSSTGCQEGTLLQIALDRWLVDASFSARVTSVQQTMFDIAAVCLTFPGLNDGSICGAENSLASVMSLLNGASITDLGLWDGQLTRFRAAISLNDGGSLSRIYIGTNETFAFQSVSSTHWRSSQGPVPDPWIYATVRVGADLSFRRLSADMLYFELQSTGAFVGEMEVLECRFVFDRTLEDGDDMYLQSCSQVDSTTPETQAIADLFRDLRPLAFSRSGLMYKEIERVGDDTRVYFRTFPVAERDQIALAYGGLPGLGSIFGNYIDNLPSVRHIANTGIYSNAKLSVSEEVFLDPFSGWQFRQHASGGIVDSRVRGGELYFKVSHFTDIEL